MKHLTKEIINCPHVSYLGRFLKGGDYACITIETDIT